MDLKTIQSIKQLSRTSNSASKDLQAKLLSKGSAFQDDLTFVQHELALARIQLSAFVAKAEKLKLDKSLCASLTAPVRLLPQEVLSEIFVLACLGDSMHLGILDRLDPPNKKIVPMCHSIIRVSTHWRKVALDTRALWKHPVVVDIGVAPSAPGNIFEVMKWRLQGVKELYRDNLTQLHIICSKPSFYRQMSQEQVRLLFDTIFNPRTCTELSLSGGSTELWISNRDSATALHTLRLAFDSGSAPTQASGVITRVHALKKLYLAAPPPGFLHLLHSKTWKHLTHLSFGSSNMDVLDAKSSGTPVEIKKDELLDLLKSLLNLVSLHLSNLILRKGKPTVSTTVEMAGLCSLGIYDCGMTLAAGLEIDQPDIGHSILSNLSTPALVAFDYVLDGRLPRSYTQMIGFGNRSPITSGQYRKTGHATFVDFLKRAPHLRQLRTMITNYPYAESCGQDSCPEHRIEVRYLRAPWFIKLQGCGTRKNPISQENRVVADLPENCIDKLLQESNSTDSKDSPFYGVTSRALKFDDARAIIHGLGCGETHTHVGGGARDTETLLSWLVGIAHAVPQEGVSTKVFCAL